jgi:hypothetical protein
VALVGGGVPPGKVSAVCVIKRPGVSAPGQ